MGLEQNIINGNKFPFDQEDGESTPPIDWAHSAARGVLNNLEDRRGIRQELENIDEDIRVEIVESIAEIIRIAEKQRNIGDKNV